MRNLQVALDNGQTIPLSQVATIQYKLEQPSIWRRDLLPTITVQADVIPGIEAKTVNGTELLIRDVRVSVSHRSQSGP